ncbi:hypothetical protein LVJ59_00135 [Microbacterium sp. KKR3/1]|uniref:O-methyltransferase n=1 Tax=Microbacterium sp. KKR3/1 TaxID=2904241 RepID=UPI001E289528|nr:O-methyltransferase [Microbacterium sp. KKR3/1]MCE0507435.1 hypothetical protein [Microbacterium sp. KKR3/1]
MAGPNYATAPLKAITREMLVEVTRRLVRYGPLRDMTYVGLGALEFVDFRLVYERLGIENLVSIEGSHPLGRLEFNRPYDSIRILQGTTNIRLPEIEELKSSRCVVWLDYTSRLRQSEHRDLAYLASVLAPGSALFVCVNRNAPEKEFEEIRQEFGDYFDENLRKVSYVGPGLADQQRIVADRIIRKHIATRESPPAIERVLDVRYADSGKMQLLGWIFGPQGSDIAADCRLGELDFTATARADQSLELAWPSLTAPEWDALTHQLPASIDTIQPPHKFIERSHVERFLAVHRWGRPSAANA